MITAAIWLVPMGVILACKLDRDRFSQNMGTFLILLGCIFATVGVNG